MWCDIHSRFLHLLVLTSSLLHMGVGVSIRLVVPTGLHCTKCGRLELMIEGQWGTVCSDLWDETDARVACRMLNFPGGGKPAKYAAFGKGSGPIHMSHVDCHGNETSLLQCSKRSGFSCTHDDDAGVVCESDATAHQTGDIRLVDGPGPTNPTSGRLTIEYHSVSGTVCRDGWNIQDSIVVCRQLGYCGGSSVVHDHGAFGMGTGPVWLTEVNCTGSEQQLLHCPHTGWANNSCDHGYDVGVVCEMCETGTIRLQGGLDNQSGIVTISNNGHWGTMCSDTWSDVEARMVCMSLGFGSGLAVSSGNFTAQTGSIWLSGVNCTGQETHVTECSHDNNGSGGWGDNGCRHYQDVAVRCLTSPWTSSTDKVLDFVVASTTSHVYTTGSMTTKYPLITSSLDSSMNENKMDKTWIITIVTIVSVVVVVVVIAVVCGVTKVKTSKKKHNYLTTPRTEPNTYQVEYSHGDGACAAAPASTLANNAGKPRDSGVYQEIDDHKSCARVQDPRRMNSYVDHPIGQAQCSLRSTPLPAVPDENGGYLQARDVHKGARQGSPGGAVGDVNSRDDVFEGFYSQINENDSSDYLEPLKLRY